MKYFILFFLCTVTAFGQVEKNSELFKQLKKMDSLLFSEAFNKCDIALLESLVTKDLEFYHDIGGFQNKKEFLDATQKNICSNPDKKIARKLVEGSLELFPLKNNGEIYGVIQNGTHQFYSKQKNEEAVLTGDAKFISFWILEENKWKLKRVFSYDHKGIE
jgi:hypothetical protein